jgi:3-methyladenine DNA glycosylase AlkC
MTEILKERYNRKYIESLAGALGAQKKSFNKKAFINSVFDDEWNQRELKSRMAHISDQINEHFDSDYKNTVNTLVEISPLFTGFEGMFIPHYVETYGLNQWAFSLKALEKITPHASAEFAIRQFILKDSNKAMAQMRKWASSKNYHVRRLSSEGCRPRLPWACSLPEFKKDPRLIIPILNELKTDSSLYVRRSVANNINDISKDNPQTTLDLVRLWQGQDKDSDWVLKHGSRSLLKASHPVALKLFSYPTPKHIQVLEFSGTQKVKIGENLILKSELQSEPPLGKLRIEYKISFVKANNKMSTKVFKFIEGEYDKSKINLHKKHSFRQMSTRTHYPGKHSASLLVNGVELGKFSFEVIKA